MGVLVIFNVQLTAEQLEVVGQGLDELKFKTAKPVAQAIQAQIDAQLRAERARFMEAQAAAAKAAAEAKAAEEAAANAALNKAPEPMQDEAEYVAETPERDAQAA